MLKSQTSIEFRGIATVLKEQRLAVPTHQRSFSWQETEVRELLDDVCEAFTRSEEYFLGTIVVISPSDKQGPTIIDGQQRLATVALLLAGMAETFAGAGDARRGEELRRQYLMAYDIQSGEQLPQLALNRDDEPYFRSLLSPEFSPPATPARDSHNRLYAARTLMSTWLSEQVDRASHPVQWLADFTTYLAESARVVIVKVPDDANAFMIFETLNDRGLDLSIADLLKNYLLGRAASDLPVVLNQWTTALASLAAHGGENLFSVFLRHFWSSQYGVAREKTLYRDIKERVSSRQQVLQFSQELALNSNHYAAMLSPEHDYWEDASPETQDHIRTLRLLGLEQYRPLLLAAMAHLRLPHVEKLVRLLVNWNVRLLIVGGLGGGVMERHYSELARAIRAGELKTGPEIAARARQFVPSDTQFGASFADATVSKVTLARYYLRALEQHGRDDQEAELLPSTKLTLEHIDPDKPLDNWPQFSDEDARASRNRLGNLVLLTGRKNSQLRSAAFDRKRPEYQKSELLLTKEVAGYQQWTKETIQQRQRGLADRAVRAWPLTVRARRASGRRSRS